MSECIDINKARQNDANELLYAMDARQAAENALRRKCYRNDEMETGREYKVSVDGRSESVRVDLIIRLAGRAFMAIKCSVAVESRSRHVLAISRVVESPVIPYSLITDGSLAHLMDTATGKVISESMDELPDRDAAIKMLESVKPFAMPSARIEKEKRILLAFECTECK